MNSERNNEFEWPGAVAVKESGGASCSPSPRPSPHGEREPSPVCGTREGVPISRGPRARPPLPGERAEVRGNEAHEHPALTYSEHPPPVAAIQTRREFIHTVTLAAAVTGLATQVSPHSNCPLPASNPLLLLHPTRR